MRHLFLAAVLVTGFCVALPAAGASSAGNAPLVLSPRAVDFGSSFHAGEQRTADVTISNPGGLPRLLKKTTIDLGSGCRAFGRTCPLRLVHLSENCPTSGPLGQGQQCQITLAFAPAQAGDLAVSVCIDSLGPIGGDQTPTAASSCVPVRAHVLAASASSPPRTSAPGSASSPAKPGAATPSAPTTGRPAIPVSSPWSGGSTPAQPAVPLAWRSAGAFVWHTDGLDPARLGKSMRANGFGWVAIRIQDGKTADKIDPDWIAQFRQASGLPVGGWGVLREQPAVEARLAGSLVEKLGLDFYIADAEMEYEYSNQSGQSAQRFARSATFVSTFRAAEPTLPAAVSSYCRADMHDLDWASWRAAGFAFMPQAYVDQFGSAAAPAACAVGAGGFFSPGDVHPTVGTFPSTHGLPSPASYGQMLKAAGTVGFSLYLAETTSDAAWAAYGQAISTLGIAG
ncbi:MAG TPA: hypothetical protein VMT59_06900 [Gaiellaceae bacterium]|nr:hypothetical protein [Gaiellaceae bacterium]